MMSSTMYPVCDQGFLDIMGIKKGWLDIALKTINVTGTPLPVHILSLPDPCYSSCTVGFPLPTLYTLYLLIKVKMHLLSVNLFIHPIQICLQSDGIRVRYN